MKKFNDDIKNWLAFNDNEIGMFQNFTFEYIKENRNIFDSEMIFNLGILCTNFQYMMRFVKEITYSKEKSSIISAKNFITTLAKYPNICVFTKNKFILYFDELSEDDKFEYLKNDKFNTSYFGRSKDDNYKLEELNLKEIKKKIKM